MTNSSSNYQRGKRIEHVATGQFGNVATVRGREVLVNWDNGGWTPVGKLADWVDVSNIRTPEERRAY